MRKFIVSDLHGNINIYNSIMNFLGNLNDLEEVELYINGDLIDRGKYSIYMLKDIKNRIENNIGFKIHYLAGNHELMMYQAFLKKWSKFCRWFYNGGKNTLNEFNKLSNNEKESIIKFISNLKIFHKFEETMNNKPIVLVHAKCPKNLNLDLRLKDNNLIISRLLWTRRDDSVFLKNIGNKSYFTIIGHTPVLEKCGYEYYKRDNALNIDGGCSAYVCGSKNYNHVPLVEINNEKLTIFTFNNSNSITMGSYFENGESVKMSSKTLDEYKKYLKK